MRVESEIVADVLETLPPRLWRIPLPLTPKGISFALGFHLDKKLALAYTAKNGKSLICFATRMLDVGEEIRRMDLECDNSCAVYYLSEFPKGGESAN